MTRNRRLEAEYEVLWTHSFSAHNLGVLLFKTKDPLIQLLAFKLNRLKLVPWYMLKVCRLSGIFSYLLSMEMIQRAILAVYSPAFIFISETENHLPLLRASENSSVPHTINIQAVSCPLAFLSPLFFPSWNYGYIILEFLVALGTMHWTWTWKQLNFITFLSWLLAKI